MHHYVLGGRNKPNASKIPEWHGHDEALILRVDDETQHAEVILRYRSPPELCPHEAPSFVFKAGTRIGDRLHLCTQTEILTCALPDCTVSNHLSLPCFNDLHHVTIAGNGNYLVAVTGLDLVAEVTPDGTLVAEWSALETDPWQRFSREVDYRRIGTTKPHLAHPNFVFLHDGDIWTTRLEQQDALNLATRETIPIGIERPHDGIVQGERAYFTIVNGFVAIVDLAEKRLVGTIDLTQIVGGNRPLGWCRGLKLLPDDRMIVAFTRLRPTRFKQNIAWAKSLMKSALGVDGLDWSKALSTRLICFDIGRKQRLWDFDVEPYGMDAVFSVL
jgi:hypothetical protein